MDDIKIATETGAVIWDDPDDYDFLRTTVISVGVGIGKLGIDYIHYVSENTVYWGKKPNAPIKYVNISSESDLLSLNVSFDKEDLVFFMVDWNNAICRDLASKVAERISEDSLNIGILVQNQPCTNNEQDIAESNAVGVVSKMDCVLRLQYDLLKTKAEEMAFDIKAMGDFYAWFAVKSITQMLLLRGMIGMDFADVNHNLSYAGNLFMGVGEAQGENAFETAANNAINDLGKQMGEQAKRLLVNIAAKQDLMNMYEVERTCRTICDNLDIHDNAECILSATPYEDSSNTVRVVIFASTTPPDVFHISEKKGNDELLPEIRFLFDKWMSISPPTVTQEELNLFLKSDTNLIIDCYEITTWYSTIKSAVESAIFQYQCDRLCMASLPIKNVIFHFQGSEESLSYKEIEKNVAGILADRPNIHIGYLLEFDEHTADIVRFTAVTAY